MLVTALNSEGRYGRHVRLAAAMRALQRRGQTWLPYLCLSTSPYPLYPVTSSQLLLIGTASHDLINIFIFMSFPKTNYFLWVVVLLFFFAFTYSNFYWPVEHTVGRYDRSLGICICIICVDRYCQIAKLGTPIPTFSTSIDFR